MSMAWIALGGWFVFLLLAFGLRTLMQYRLTGSSGFVGFHGRPLTLPWLGGVLFVVATLGCPLSCALDLAGLLPRWSLFAGPVAQASGLVLYGLGLVGTLWAQRAMGQSWRIGVDPSARTKLVESGPFAVCRNPIFSCMLVLAVGLTILVPNLVSLLSALMLLLGLEIQVRLVEEPYLLQTHGDSYARYAAKTGRFFPGIGTL